MPNKKLYKLTDGSWHVLLKDEKLAQELPQSGRFFLNHRYEILATNLSLPALPWTGGQAIDCKFQCIHNDTIIRDVDQGKIYFTHKDFLREIQMCRHCGTELEVEAR